MGISVYCASLKLPLVEQRVAAVPDCSGDHEQLLAIKSPSFHNITHSRLVLQSDYPSCSEKGFRFIYFEYQDSVSQSRKLLQWLTLKLVLPYKSCQRRDALCDQINPKTPTNRSQIRTRRRPTPGKTSPLPRDQLHLVQSQSPRRVSPLWPEK